MVQYLILVSSTFEEEKALELFSSLEASELSQTRLAELVLEPGMRDGGAGATGGALGG